MIDAREVDRAVAALTDASVAASPRDLISSASGIRATLSSPGLYSWWADDEARETVTQVLGGVVCSLVYIGQAGATKARSGTESGATLFSRIAGQHLGGNARSSTFRLTVSAILLDPFKLTLGGPGRLTAHDNSRVTSWIENHLQLVVYPFTDRGDLEELEDRVLLGVDPPLNLQGMPPTPLRTTLIGLRRRIRQGGPTVANSTIGGIPASVTPQGSIEGRHVKYHTQRVTAIDIGAGRIRIPSAGDTKSLFPRTKEEVAILLRGERMRVRWDPRLGPDKERSGVLSVGRAALEGRVLPDEVLEVTRDGDAYLIG